MAKRIRCARANRFLLLSMRPRAVSFIVSFRGRRVEVVEKIIDNIFEYSFAYEYWPSGRLKTVASTRACAGVLIEFDDQV